MAIRRLAAVGLVLFVALAAGLASQAAATEYKAKPTLGRAHLKVEFEVEKKGTVRELEVKDVEKIALPNGTYTLNVSITTSTGTVVLPGVTVTLKKGEFKKVKIRQANSGTLFSVTVPPTSVTVSLAGTGGNVSFPAAAFRKD